METEQQLIRRLERIWKKYNKDKNPNRPVAPLPDAPY